MFSAVVFTAGRTGSHIIMENLCMHFKVPRRYSSSSSLQGVMHTHYPFTQPFSEDCVCVVSSRGNILDSILSSMIVRKTEEVREYTNKCVKPFTVPKDEVWDSYIYHKVFYLLIDKTKFNKVVEIEYESILSNPKYLFSKFGIDKDVKLYGKKSPYNYYEIIENIEEVKTWYSEFEKSGITEDMVLAVSSNIELDLQQVHQLHQTKV